MKLDPLAIWIQCLLIFGALLLGGGRAAGTVAVALGLALFAARVMEGRK
jgi:hypothetical protein